MYSNLFFINYKKQSIGGNMNTLYKYLYNLFKYINLKYLYYVC